MYMDWVKEGVNYWENPDCPRDYLEYALIKLIEEVEGAELPNTFYRSWTREDLIAEIKFYEYVSEK